LAEISQEEVDAAVTAGVLDRGVAESLRSFVEQRQRSSVPDEEQFRLLTSFNDIFVALAAVLALFAVAALGSVVAVPLSGLLLMGASWLLSVEFTAKRRMALPSIVLAIGFIVGGAITVGAEEVRMLAAIIAAAVHWWRFRVPITPAAGFSALAFVIFSLDRDFSSGLAFVLGLAGFAWAMWWDRSDLERRTRRSDVAFWLHLVSSGLVVHPLFLATGLIELGGSAQAAVGVIALYGLLTLLALAIDRRAMLVAALFYLLWATGKLVAEVAEPATFIPAAALVTGGGLLLLSAFWSRARAAFIGRFPDSWRRTLPPTAPTSLPA
jgi:hypothetical protein